MDIRKDNFIRIAERRTNRILEMIDSLGNLSNKSYYDYTDEQIELIFKAIHDALREVKLKFNSAKKENKKFKL